MTPLHLKRDRYELRHARASLVLSVAMGVLTTIHHWHAHVFVPHDGPGLHIVWNELVLIPLTIVTMVLYLRRRSRIALLIYFAIVLAGFVGLGLYEGLWNHTLKVLAHLRLDTPGAEIGLILPPDDPHKWFYEVTGVLTFVVAAAAAWATVLFAQELRRPSDT